MFLKPITFAFSFKGKLGYKFDVQTATKSVVDLLVFTVVFQDYATDPRLMRNLASFICKHYGVPTMVPGY